MPNEKVHHYKKISTLTVYTAPLPTRRLRKLCPHAIKISRDVDEYMEGRIYDIHEGIIYSHFPNILIDCLHAKQHKIAFVCIPIENFANALRSTR